MNFIKKRLIEISKNFLDLADQSIPDIKKASKLIISSLKRDKKIMFCGNGGSAADAQHLSAELVGRYLKKRKPLPSISLATDTSILTAVANDFSFDEVFSRQVEAIGKKGDVLYAISTSGKSRNIIQAIKKAKKIGIKTIGITGNDRSTFDNICDVVISVPSSRPDRIQEMHIATGQIICELVEVDLC